MALAVQSAVAGAEAALVAAVVLEVCCYLVIGFVANGVLYFLAGEIEGLDCLEVAGLVIAGWIEVLSCLGSAG